MKYSDRDLLYIIEFQDAIFFKIYKDFEIELAYIQLCHVDDILKCVAR